VSTRGFSPTSFAGNQKWHDFAKGVLVAHLLPEKQHPRALIVRRVALQWQRRATLFRFSLPFTQAHADLVDDLLRLSIGQYAAVRIPAQKALGQALSIFPMV
jgi:hypothetical protein